MVWFCILFCLLLSFIGYRYHKEYFAPTVIAPLVWGGILFLYEILDNPLNDLSPKVLLVIGVWIACFFVGALLFSLNVNNHQPPRKVAYDFAPSIRTVYYFISVLACLPLLYIAYKQGTELPSDSFWVNLRYANVHQKEIAPQYQYGIWGYAANMAFIALLIEVFSGDRKRRIYTLMFVNILEALITASKTSFFFLSIVTIFILMYQQRISVKIVVSTVLSLAIVMVVLHNGRSEQKTPLMKTMYTYVFAGIPALDQLVTNNIRNEPSGIETFRFVYNVNEKIFAAPYVQRKFIPDISDNGYFFVPYPTNVYTVIGPFWLDFRWNGVVFAGFFMGILSGFLYKKMKHGYSWALIAYSYMFCILVLQSFGEYIFRTLSTTIQIIALIWLAYSFKWSFKWQQ